MEEKNERVSGREIDLSSILNMLKRHIVPLLLVTVIFGSAFYVYSSFFITKNYEASATLIVNNVNKNKNTVNSTEITAAQGLADVYSIIIKSDAVMVPVIQNLGLDDSAFVDSLYRSMMDREADEDGKNYWMDKLANGTSREEVFLGFAKSVEFNNLCKRYGVSN